MAIAALMGIILFVFGVVLMVIAFLAVLGFTAIIEGWLIYGFTIFGFILCLTGYMMARGSVSDVVSRLRK